MRSMLVIHVWLSVLCAATFGADKARILLVGAAPDHPWGSHMYQFECELLATCLRGNSGIEAQAIAAWPPTADELKGVKSIVFYSSPAGSIVLADEHRAAFLKLMDQGVGFVAIHWGTGVGYGKLADREDIRDQYRSILGGWFRRPPSDVKIGEAMLELRNPHHPIARGWEPWKIRDEFYLNPVLDERAAPLISVEVDGQRQVVAWTHERSRGRSFGITLGHFHHNFARDDFRRLLVNGILWSAHEKIPDTGAVVQIDAARLTLPPEN